MSGVSTPPMPWAPAKANIKGARKDKAKVKARVVDVSIVEETIMPGTVHTLLREKVKVKEKVKVSLVERQVGREKVKAKERD